MNLLSFHSIRTKILLSLLSSTLLLGLVMVIFAQTVIRHRLLNKLQEKGVAIARKIAADSVNPVITERYFEVAMMFRDLQGMEEDIVYGYVLDEDGRDLAHTFAAGVSPELKKAHPVPPLLPSSSKELATDKGPVLDIGVPLLRGQIGVLHLGFSLTSIRKDVNEIVLLFLASAAGALIIGAAVGVGFSRAVTRPLLKLAGAAEVFGRGGTREFEAIASKDEVGELARAFDEMIENRNRIEEDRERLIAELRQALDEVKTLRGIVPICSYCKRIRNEAGEWQQIEAYVTRHSEAQFSHGLCPECLSAHYPRVSPDTPTGSGQAPRGSTAPK